MTDWRQQGQEKYLEGKKFIFRRYSSKAGKWDHDHCEFCWAKIGSAEDDDYHEGYCTMDGYHWVCPVCFKDFEESLNFSVQEPESS